MYDSDSRIYMSLTGINETSRPEDPHLPVATLPAIMSSTVSSSYILEVSYPSLSPSYSRY